MNAVYDIDEDIAASTQAGDFSKINTGDAENDEVTGHFGADAKQTRFGIKTVTPEGVKIVIEGDARASDLRLRHAYGEYNGVLAGQYWSNFNSFTGFTPTLDFDSVSAAGLFDRVAQLRYTTGPFSVALEEPKSSIFDITETRTFDPDNTGTPKSSWDYSEADGSKDSMPTLTARFEDSAGSVSYSAAGLVHQVGYDEGDADDSSMGYGLFVAGKVAVTDMISIQGSLNYSDGANSYMWRSGENYYADDAYVAPNGDVETITTYGGTLGTSINLGNSRSINIVYGMAHNDYDDARKDFAASADSANQLPIIDGAAETNQAIFANYQFAPVENVTMGVEYQYLMTEDVDGDDGDANRVMFMAKYSF